MGLSAQHHAVEGPISEKKTGNSLFLRVKERTIANCWDKMEIPVDIPTQDCNTSSGPRAVIGHDDFRSGIIRLTPQLLFVFFVPLLFTLHGRGRTHIFDYESNIGLATEQSGTVCLAINNDELATGHRIALVVFTTPQSIAQTDVLRRLPSSCQSTDASNANFAYYELRVVEGTLAPSAPAVAVVDPAQPLKVLGRFVVGDLEGDRHPEYFRECTSKEGVHLSVWTGKPLRGKRRWHRYYYLGYDVERNCTSKETKNSGPLKALQQEVAYATEWIRLGAAVPNDVKRR